MPDTTTDTRQWEVAEIISKELATQGWFNELVKRDIKYINIHGFLAWIVYASINDKYPQRVKDSMYENENIQWDVINDKLASLLVDQYEDLLD